MAIYGQLLTNEFVGLRPAPPQLPLRPSASTLARFGPLTEGLLVPDVPI